VLVWDIIVNAPPVQAVTADPVGNTIQINWAPYFCENVDFYRVYRKSDSTTFDESCCDITNLLDAGYELVSETADTHFTDNSELAIGNRYCYVVTAVMENGTESCPSAIGCAQLEFSVPILTNVTIFETNDAVGKDSVRWTHPQELNVIQFPGPYQYRLYRGIGTQFPNELVFQTTAEANLLDCDTFFVDENLNTVLNEYRYRIELWSGGNVVGSGASSSSVYLTLVPNDNQLELFWTTNTSWYVDSTEVFRETSSGTGVYNSIGWSYSNYFLDTPLVNLQAYCYKVKTYGHYSLPTVDSPLINWSQEVCGEPFDYTPPCAPVLTVEVDCSVAENVLSWTNPNNSCADDVTRYAIYFAAQENEELEFLMLIDGDTDTTFRHFLPLGTPGCYYVTAIDSIPYNNESEPSNVVCVEHCDPLYVLPNVITANNDGINDVFHPKLPFKFVERVDFKLFNRWGQLLFQTDDPMINWDGTIQENGKKVVEGVYFYACRVYFLTLSGEDFIDLHGFVTVFN
jgi:gliding motility-associated-like protein